MVVKSKNIVPVNLSKEAILCLQVLEYLNGNKKSTGKKNLSQFISRLVVEHVGITYPLDANKIKEKVIKIQLFDLQKDRDVLDDGIKDLALSLSAINEAKRNKEGVEG